MALFRLAAVLFAVLLDARDGNGRNTGAPTGACSTITPNHGGSSGTLPGGYYLYSNLIDSGGAYTSGTVYTIRLEGSNQFRGFLIQARLSGTTIPIGSFNTPSGTKVLSCSGVPTATVTHTNSNLKSSVTFQWTAPSGTGTVKFQYAVVQAFSTYYANIDSSVFQPPVPPPSTTLALPSSTPAPPPTTSATSMTAGSSIIVPVAASSANTVFTTTSVVGTIRSSTMPTTPMETPLAPPTCPATDKTASSNFPLTFGTPSGCSRTSCDVYVAMAPNTMNSSYLDIYMEGTAAGWVAVGFSDSRAMENTDVIGCRVDSGSTVSVVDTWNPSPNYTPNQVDDTQDGVCTHSTSFNNGRIRCLFSRYGPVIDTGRDFDLNTSRYILYGRRTAGNSGEMNLQRHSSTPARTAKRVSPFNVTGEAPVVSDYPDKALLQIHGILMLISWPILATFAIFFASWMKPALPNGEWFQTHRALLVISLFITVAGFIFAFVALAMNETPGLISFNTTSQRVHFAFGIIVVLFQIINPIIAIFRCKPKSSNRSIFDLAHASFVGVVAEVLAMTNVGIGLSLFSQRYSPGTLFISLWMYFGYNGLLVILEVVMHVVFIAAPEDREKLMPTMLQWCFSSKSDKYQTSEIELEEKGNETKTPDQNEKKERKPASRDAHLRWVGVVVGVGVLVFSTILIVAVIVMVAIG